MSKLELAPSAPQFLFAAAPLDRHAGLAFSYTCLDPLNAPKLGAKLVCLALALDLDPWPLQALAAQQMRDLPK